ncbi:MAG: AraC family transcriptional regulator [Victivallaceae bacterium]|nr:AraC family transcriptional regulator [Victivallaceae bacterium]
MELNYQEINGFFKKLIDLRENINIVDFFLHPQIVHINCFLPRDKSEVHEQRTFEISLLLKGDMIYTIAGEEIFLEAGDVVIIPPRIKHYWQILEEKAVVFSFMVYISRHGEGARRHLNSLLESVRKHNYCIKKSRNIEHLVKLIINEVCGQKTGCNENTIYLISQIFVEFLRVMLPDFHTNKPPQSIPPARGENQKDIVEMIYYYIQDNMDRSISLNEISNYIGLSAKHLNFLFKNETGTTINQAIINRRLKWACRYLKQTDRQIKDIATSVGYRDINYFYLQFKKKYGMTPSRYRYHNS